MSGHVADGVFQPLGADDPTTVAEYRLAARLGSGGMGKVYLSYTPGGRAVAIKVIRPELAEDPGFRRRFRQEVEAAQRVQGLCTAPVVASDPDAPQPWLATAFVPGPTLDSAVGEHGPLPTQTVLLLVAGIAEALQSIHGAGIVHRDLKPSNVLLAADGPRVIDFGIARAADATALTGSGMVIGTPAFMAPEQAQFGHVGEATDIFALGQVAAYSALGAAPYGDGPSHAVLYRIVHEEPDLSGLPAELLPMVARCLAKDPAQRPSLTEIIAMCRAAADDSELRRHESWLPQPITTDITERHAAPTRPPTAVVRQDVPPVPAAAPTSAPVPTPTQQATPAPPRHAPPVRPNPPSVPQMPTVSARPTVQGGHPQGPPTPPPMMAPGPPMMPGPQPVHGPPMAHPTHPGGYPAYPVPPRTDKRRNRMVLAGILGAAVLVFGGCSAVLHQVGAGTDSDIGDRTNSSGTSHDTGGVKGAKAGKAAAPKPVVFRGLHLPDGYHYEFADASLQPKESNYDDFYYMCDFMGCGFGSYDTHLVLLDSTEKGSLDTCRKETRFTTQIPIEHVSAGSRICAITPAGDVVLLTYHGVSAKSDPSQYVTLDATVWRRAVSSS